LLIAHAKRLINFFTSPKQNDNVSGWKNSEVHKAFSMTKIQYSYGGNIDTDFDLQVYFHWITFILKREFISTKTY
jgi:hypothetical protein